MDKLLQNLSLEQLSLAFQVLQNAKEMLVPQELQYLSQEEWVWLECLLDELMAEKDSVSVH